MFPHVDHLLNLVDLIDAPFDLNISPQSIPDMLVNTLAWDNHPSLPWINWNVNSYGKQNMETTFSSNIPLGKLMFLLFLPGTITLYYGDELGLDQTRNDSSSCRVMMWDASDYGGFSSVEPLWDIDYDWEEKTVIAKNDSIDALKKMVIARQTQVPLYINGIFDYEGDYHPTKSTNYRVRFTDENLIIMDRFYPRRNKFALVVNFGSETLQRDLSSFYFGGSVLTSTHGQEGYIKFRNITLHPGEGLALILDL